VKNTRLVALLAAVLAGSLGAGAQTPTGGPVPQKPPPSASPASKRPPQTVAQQSYPPEQVQAGQPLFSAQCGFCHGRDAAGGESGPDLTRSTLVAEDVRGDKIGPVVRNGRADKGMPPMTVSDSDLAALVAFIHDRKAKAESEQGGRRSVDVADLQTGNAEAGRRYFNGAGACATCHSPTGDLAGVGKRFEGLALLQRLLYPGSGSNAGARPAPPKVSVTLPSGELVTGRLAYRDEFTIAMTDASGWYRSWPVDRIKFTVDNPLEAHVAQLGKYTDDDMHNVFAYLQTLR
jgi:cytochrome c oxidase cbb3-type subunit 3